MFKKSNDRLGNPSHLDKQIQPGQLDGSKSRTGDPTESQSCTSNSKIGHINTVNDKISWPGHPIDDADASTKNVFSVLKNSKQNHELKTKTKKRKLSQGNSSEQNTKQAKTEDTSAKKSFQKSWLDEFKWLKFENDAMFCSLCILHKSKSKFSLSGSKNFRISTLREHKSSSGHVNSVQLDTETQSKKIPSVSDCIVKEFDKIEAAVCRLIRTAYTVAKTNLPISMYSELCQLQLCNNMCLTKNLYQEDSACSEFIRLISDHLDETLLVKLRNSLVLGLMVDESTDLGLEKHMIVFINYIDNGSVQTKYLTLIKLASADSSVVYNSLISYFRACDIDISTVYGFGSDGAAVMTGKHIGVANRLKEQNPYMLSMHCVAHKLALSSLDAAKSVKEVRYYEGALHSIHAYFSRSSKRLEHLRVWQEVLDDPKIKPLGVHQIRWLSFANCVTNVRRSLKSLLKSLQSDSDDDQMAESPYCAMSSYKFLLTHFFSDIMSDIAQVSRKFQERNLHYCDLHETLVAVCDSIEQQYLIEEPTYGKNLGEFLEIYGNAETFHDFEIKRHPRDARLPVVVSEFSRILRDSIQSRFPRLEIWDAFSIFNPEAFPKSVEEKAKFGSDKMNVLLEHFGEKRGPDTPPVCADGAK